MVATTRPWINHRGHAHYDREAIPGHPKHRDYNFVRTREIDDMTARPTTVHGPVWVGILALVASLVACGDTRESVLVPDDSRSFAIMSFTEPFPLDPLPDGWYHRRFWRHGPMDISFETKEEVHAIRLATHDTASMLFRHVDIELGAYPVLSWQWYIEKGIDSEVDELTRAGDDHPARFFVVFETPNGETHPMEIIWGNRSLRAGDYKVIGSFPHYVANGGRENVGRWHQEAVDLTEIYETLWGDPVGARMIDIAILCDSDETGDETLAYVADVRVQRR